MADITANTPGAVQPGSLIEAASQQPAAGQITSVQNQITPVPSTPVAGVNAAQATAALASSQNFAPTGVAVADDQTVQGELSKILDANSPLLQQARTRANQEANERGLLDSSLAVQAGQAAVTSQALPIAQQDAATRFAANQQTVANQQAAAAANAQAANVAKLQNSSLETQTSQQNAGMINAALGNTAQAINTQNLSYLDKGTQLQLGQLNANVQQQLGLLDAQNKQLLQTNSSAATAFANVVTAIANIAQNATLNQGAKDMATQTQINLLNQELQQLSGVASTPTSALGSLNLSQYFTPTTNPAAPAPPNASYLGYGGQYYPTQDAANQSFYQAGQKSPPAPPDNGNPQTPGG